MVETASVVRAVSEENAARAAIVGDRADACADATPGGVVGPREVGSVMSSES